MRPLTEQDIPRMQELFRGTVLTVNARDYTEDEVKDWASCGDNVEHWKELMVRKQLYRSNRYTGQYHRFLINEQRRPSALHVCPQGLAGQRRGEHAACGGGKDGQ